MCNACGNVCCGSDEFEKCGCDGCDCAECWSDEPEDMDDDMDFELLNPPMENSGDTGNARAAAAMTGNLPVAAAPTISTTPN